MLVRRATYISKGKQKKSVISSFQSAQNFFCFTNVKVLNNTAYFTANAAKEHMSPYFQQIVEMLKGYLTVDQADETMSLQVQSLGNTFIFYSIDPFANCRIPYIAYTEMFNIWPTLTH